METQSTLVDFDDTLYNRPADITNIWNSESIVSQLTSYNYQVFTS